MNIRSIIDNWIGFIFGVSGYGFVSAQFVWRTELLRICVAGAVAFVAGGMGVAGKYLFIWVWKKVMLYIKIKK